jgi:hypothetical protein
MSMAGDEMLRRRASSKMQRDTQPVQLATTVTSRWACRVRAVGLEGGTGGEKSGQEEREGGFGKSRRRESR